MSADYVWLDREDAMREMLLTEPGSRIEGPTEEVLRVLYASTVQAGTARGLTEQEADVLALLLVGRAHAALADAGYVVRELKDG